MKKSLFSLLLLIITYCAYAQYWFHDHPHGEKISGYILGMAGDTIEGHIKYDYPVIMQKRVAFYVSAKNDSPIMYSPENIWGYTVNGKKWISTTVKFETYSGPYSFKRFGILESGNDRLMLLRIFEERDKLKKNVNSEEAELYLKNIMAEYPEKSFKHLYIKKTDGEAIPLGTKEFKKSFPLMMRTYIGDHPELMQRVDEKELTVKDIHEIVKEYNRWYQSTSY